MGVSREWDMGGVLVALKERVGVAGVKSISDAAESMDSLGVSGIVISLRDLPLRSEGEAEGVMVRLGARDRLFAGPKTNWEGNAAMETGVGAMS
jgi:hypothetical protein